MTLRDKTQDKNSIMEESYSLLVELKRITNKKTSSIALDLGVGYNTLWRVETKRLGSRQLLTGLRLLLEVEKLRRKKVELEIEKGQLLQRLGEQAFSSGSRYPEHQPSHYESNDKTVSSEEKSGPDLSKIRQVTEAGLRRRKKQ